MESEIESCRFARLVLRAGYLPARPALYRVWNVTVAGTLIVVLSPVLLIISTALLLTQGRDVIYCGPRLGKGRAPFQMYKFRTLKRGTDRATPPEGLMVKAALTTPLGQYLRATRLDELPQLFNVLKGDMNLMGPRPVRAETATMFAAALPGYEARFAVAPGLVGYTQALMTHDTSKVIRKRFNSLLCRRPVSLHSELIFLARTAFAMMNQVVIELADRLNLALLGVRHDRRQHARVRPRHAPVMIMRGDTPIGWGYLLDIDPQAFTIISPIPLSGTDSGFRLICFVGARRRTATCIGHSEPALRPRPIGGAWRGDYCYLVRYRPASALSHYIIDRYLLGNCVVLNVRPLRHLVARLLHVRRPRLALARTALLGVVAALLAALVALPVRAIEQHVASTAPHTCATEPSWNVPVSCLTGHPDSRALAHSLWREGSDRPGNFNLSFEAYTYAVYDADEATGEYPVVTIHSSNLANTPWHPSWKPPPGSDGQVIVLDPTTGREWNLFQVAFDGRTVRATRANLVPGDYHTRTEGFPPSRGAGIPYLAMLVRPHEIEHGIIAHALSMPIRNVDGRFIVPPATKLEHPHGRPGIPHGTRFALNITPGDIDAWIAKLPRGLPEEARRSARVIAEALRDYGWIITDTSGGAHLQFESRVSAGVGWAALGLAPAAIDGREYPRDLLDGLVTPERIYALAPPDPRGLTTAR